MPATSRPVPRLTRAVQIIPFIVTLLVFAYLAFTRWADHWKDRPVVHVYLEANAKTLLEQIKQKNGDQAVGITGLRLDLTCMQLRDEDFITLAGIWNLQRLNLSKTNVTDAKLAILISLRNLDDLDLSYTHVTDSGIETLKKMRRLKSLDVSRTEVTASGIRNIQEAIPGIKASRFASDTEFGGGCIYPSLGKFVLVQYGRDRGAFRFTETTDRGDGGAKYVWYYWKADAEGHFARAPSDQGQGEVFEKYRVVEPKPDGTLVEDDGGELRLSLGRIKLTWSVPLIVYFPAHWGDFTPTKMALTDWEQLEDIDFGNKSLQWYERQEL